MFEKGWVDGGVWLIMYWWTKRNYRYLMFLSGYLVRLSGEPNQPNLANSISVCMT